jgi:hypothetical protein
VSEQASHAELDEARVRAALLEAIRGTVLSFEGEYEGQAVVARYRPGIALTITQRRSPDPSGPSRPVLDLLTFYADLLVELTIDGRSVPMGRAALTAETFVLMLKVAPAIVRHAEAWLKAETDARGPYMQCAARLLRRGNVGD